MKVAGLKSKMGVGIKILTNDQIKMIHLATLRVLKTTGVTVYEKEAKQLLMDAGCVSSGKKVMIPEHLIVEAVRSAPKTVTLGGRRDGTDLHLEDRRIHFGLGSNTTNVLDLETGKRRASRKQDIADAAKLVDALPNINFMMSLCSALDVPKEVSDRHEIEAMLLNTAKPIIAITYGRDGARDAIKMASLAVGDFETLRRKPILALYSEPVAPLQHDETYTGNMIEFAKAKIPVVYGPCDQAGATSPATLIGTVVQANAEVLSGLVIHQLACKGAPFIYAVISTIMDMRTTVMSYGAPEFTLINAASAQMAQYYKLPFFGTGGVTDSKVPDGQAASEAAISMLMAALSGTNLIHDNGYLESGLTGSHEMIVICDEIAGMVSRILRGVNVDDETMAVNVIDRVGPGGTFIADEHTLKFFEQEHWVPRIMDRRRYGAWEKDGQKTLRDRARETAKKILREKQISPLPEDVKNAISNIVKESEKRSLEHHEK